MLKNLFVRYRDLILYAVFGLLTTLVNTAVYWLCAHPLGMPVVPSSVAAWILAVLFAYLTNRTWVFHSEARGGREIAREVFSFFLARLATGALDWALMYVFAEKLGWNDMLVKIAVNILVIVLNYIASRLIVFRHKTKQKPSESSGSV